MKKSLFFENAKLLGEELVNLGHTKVKEFGSINRRMKLQNNLKRHIIWN